MSQLRAGDAFTSALREDDPVALYDQAPCGYLSTTPAGVLVKVNATFCGWTGHEPHELLGRPLTSLLTPGGRVFLETRYVPMLHLQGSVREATVDLVRKDGSRLPVLLNATLDAGADDARGVVRIAVFDATERRRYERHLLEVTQAARQAQHAAEQARAEAEEAERRARSLVDTLQSTLVPQELPDVPGLLTAGAYRPAGDGSQVGGDFYDVVVRGRDECWVVLGDVSGKGVDAAVVTGLLRHATRALTLAVPSAAAGPGQVLTMLNELLCHHDTDRFCTAAVLRLRRTTAGAWQVAYSSGGHPPLLWRGPAGVRAVEVAGHLVGIFEDATFDEEELLLRPGETLTLHTDGVTEARGPAAFYGEERLHAVLGAAEHEPRAMVAAVLDDVLAFQGGTPRDDIACLTVAAAPATAPAG